jgi:hypothetical protein
VASAQPRPAQPPGSSPPDPPEQTCSVVAAANSTLAEWTDDHLNHAAADTADHPENSTTTVDANPCKASPEVPWSEAMLSEDPHDGYSSKQVAWLSPYPDLTDANIFGVWRSPSQLGFLHLASRSDG